jgi:hypothetical protein
MRLAKFLTAVAVASMATAPVMAQSASKLSVSKAVKASTKTSESSELAGGALIGVLAAAAVIAGIVVAVGGDDEDDADSN